MGVIFRYKDGRIIPIKTDDISTNDYMNEKIRQSVLTIKNKPQTYELYHGSSNDFEQFDDKYIGKNSRGGLAYGKGHYFTGEKSDVYGQKGYKVNIKLKNPFIVQEQKWSAELEKMGYNWFNFNRPDPSDFLSNKGYDGTIIKNNDKIAEVIVYTNKDNKIKIKEKINNY